MPPPSQPITLRDLAGQIDVTSYLSYRDFLRSLYDAAKGRNESYSYGRLAADLGFSATNVVRLMIIGSRPLTVKGAERMAKALAMPAADRRYFLTLVAYANARVPATRDALFATLLQQKAKAKPQILSQAAAEYFSEWYHPVVRELCGSATAITGADMIKERLAFPLRLDEIKRSLGLLVRLGLVKFDAASGTYRRGEDLLRTASEVDSLAVVRYHQSMIGLGREAITTVEEERRDVRAITVSLPEQALVILKGKLEEWIEEVAALERSSGGGEQVVQVNMQMFPFTRKTGGHREP